MPAYLIKLNPVKIKKGSPTVQWDTVAGAFKTWVGRREETQEERLQLLEKLRRAAAAQGCSWRQQVAGAVPLGVLGCRGEAAPVDGCHGEGRWELPGSKAVNSSKTQMGGVVLPSPWVSPGLAATSHEGKFRGTQRTR